MHRLSARRVETAPPGRHSDGGGLILNVRPSGARAWTFRYQRDGRRAEIGLGAWPAVSLAKARRLAFEARAALADGRDLAGERRQRRANPTLAEMLDRWIRHRAGMWKRGMESHTAKMTPRLFERHLPGLMRRRVSDITERAIVEALKPVWTAHPETAAKLRDRLRLTLQLAKAEGFGRALDWAEIAAALPQGRPAVQHLATLPLTDVPGCAAKLAERDTVAARALLFAILTAARSGEARGAMWDEIDWAARVWRIPAERMKARRPHEVPLTEAAVALLQRAKAEGELLWPGNPIIFPGANSGKPMFDVPLTKTLRALGFPSATVHGFRAAFRTWAAEIGADREVAEACLAHGPQGGAVERAYQRGQMIERRRALLERWAGFLAGHEGAVVPFRRPIIEQ